MAARAFIVQHVPLAACIRLLQPAECARALSFSSRQAARRFATTRCAVRHVLARALHTAPMDVRLGQEPSGALRVDAAGWQISISHARSCSAFALAPDTALGIDIELVRPVEDATRIAEHFLHSDEAHWVNDGDPAKRSERFLRLWVRKEAVVKAAKQGLHMRLDDWPAIKAQRAGPGPFAVRAGSDLTWWVHDFDVPGHVLALATASDVDIAPPRWIVLGEPTN